MGYYSKVAIALNEDHWKQLVERVKKADLNNDWLKRFVNNPRGVMETPDEKYVLLTTECKWCTLFPEIHLIESFLRRHRHSFIRIGESTDDIETDFMVEDDEGVDEEFY